MSQGANSSTSRRTGTTFRGQDTAYGAPVDPRQSNANFGSMYRRDVPLNPLSAGGRNVGPAPADPLAALGSADPSANPSADPFANISGLTSQAFREFLGTGSPIDTTGVESAINDQFGLLRSNQSADLRERLGGLGLRFSSPLIAEERKLNENLGTQQSSILANLRAGSGEAAQGRRFGMLGTALQLPMQLQALSQQGDQSMLERLLLALQFAGQFAPIGQSGRSLNFGVGSGVLTP